MKAELLEKYGIGKRKANVRGVSSNATSSKVKFAADLGIDPSGLNFFPNKRSDSAAPIDE